MDWLRDALRRPMVKSLNRFAFIRLNNDTHSRITVRVQKLAENDQKRLLAEWDRQTLLHQSGRFDQLLDWGRKHLQDVALSERPFSSLYDELRVRIAVSFGGNGRFQLVLGDLSGIQSYLFAVAHIGEGGVAKRLRSRSFHLSLLAKTAAFYILDSLELSYRHLIMTAGGVFMLAVREEDQLEPILKDMDQYLYTRYHGSLQLHLATQRVSVDQLDAVSNIIGSLHNLIQRSKMQPANQVLKLNNEERWDDSIWLHDRQSGSYCVSCRRHPVREDVPDETLCAYCSQDEQNGMALPQSQAMWIGRNLSNGAPNHAIPCKHAGVLWDRYDVWLLRDAKQLPELMRQAGYWERWVDDPCDLSGISTACWMNKAYVSNYIPQEDGVPVHFEGLAGMSVGKKMLGIFKADVDRLGLLLSYGLRSDQGDFSFAEYLKASRQLEEFFGERLTVHLSDKFPHLYTVFSGGDDMFLIGPWSELPDLAVWMRREFEQFVEGNPEVTLSASLLFVPPRAPIATFAREADRRLEQAKEQANPFRPAGDQGGRNQVAICGITVEWSDLPTIWERAKQWAEWVRAGVCSSQFILRLLELWELRETYVRDGKIDGLRYNALLNYAIRRTEKTPIRDELREERRNLLAWAESLRRFPNDEAARDWYLMPAVYRLFAAYRAKEGDS
jgi:CRISPR-associated protein Csm1